MSGILPGLANTLWGLAALPEALRFRRALADVAGTQQRVLRRILQANRRTEFGRRHDFEGMASAADFRRRVPLTDYEGVRAEVERVAAGAQGVLTAAPVTLLEPTSGSAAAPKLIPYGAPLRQEFQRAIAPWIVELFRRDPALLAGRAYWSVSPAARPPEISAGGIPIGFEDDTAYLGRTEACLVRGILAVPPLLRQVPEMESFWYLTLLFLLRCRDLTLVSVWNPTFLLILAGKLKDYREGLVADIAAGSLRPPQILPAPLAAALGALNRPDRQRAAELRALFRADLEPGELHRRLWPRLRLISCWRDAHAADSLPTLRRLFPGVALQGKGLLATEAVVSIPVGPGGAPVPALRSHFFEFLPTSGGDPRLVHELTPGETYSVVVTTGGGLYRYRMYDLVEVTGLAGASPLLRFVGKESGFVDRFGEKLSERHVREALGAVLRSVPVEEAAFAMVAFDETPTPAYVLFIEAGAAAAAIREAAAALEERLRENFHYRYCRDLGQLGPLRAFRIERGGAAAYLEHCRCRGQRPGDVKPVALHRDSGWGKVFRGRLLS